MRKYLYLALVLAVIPATAVADNSKDDTKEIQLTCPIVKPEIVYVDKFTERVIYADRIVEKIVYVDKPVYVDRIVYVDKPVIQTVEVIKTDFVYRDKYIALKAKYDALYKKYKVVQHHERKHKDK